MNLLTVSLTITILGISVLLLIMNIQNSSITEIEKLNYNFLNKQIKVSGQIIKIQDKETFQIITIQDSTGEIDVLCNCCLQENQKVLIEGKLTGYKNTLQIQADKIIEN